VSEEELGVGASEDDHGEVFIALDLVDEARQLRHRVSSDRVDRPMIERDPPVLRRHALDRNVGCARVSHRSPPVWTVDSYCPTAQRRS
jgi:hypothetical protein